MTDQSKRTYETLDAIAVVGSLAIIGGVLFALCVADIPQNNLPVLASIASTVLALATAYGAFRWGNSAQQKAGSTAGQAAVVTTETVVSAEKI